MHLLLPSISAGILLATWMPTPVHGMLAGIALLLVVTVGSVCFGSHWLTLRRSSTAAFEWGRSVGVTVSVTVGLGVGLGVLYHALWAHNQLQGRLPLALEGRDVYVQGFVGSLPRQLPHGTQFEFQVLDSVTDNVRQSQISGSDAYSDWLAGRRLLLTDYGGGREWQGASQHSLVVRLKRPRSLVNEAGFDFAGWLLQNKLVATGYVRDNIDSAGVPATELSLSNVLSNTLQFSIPLSITTLRQALRDRLQPITQHLPQGGLIQALALGDRGQLSPAQWDLFSRTGTNHLFVISGLHIGLVAVATLWLGNRLLAIVPGSGRRWPRQKSAVLIALIAAGLYSILAGLTLPTQRAFIMTAAFLLSHLFARAMPLSFRFQLALLVVLLVNPLAATAIGFWLSFLAVGGLLCFAGSPPNSRSADSGIGSMLTSMLKSILRPQWVVFLLLLIPLTAQIGYFSVISPMVNTLAIPLVGLLIVPLVLLGTLCALFSAAAASWLLVLADRCLQWLLTGLQMLDPASTWLQLAVTPANIPVMLLAMLGLLLILLPRSFPGKFLAPVLLLPMFWPAVWRPAVGNAEVTVFDVGQGLAVLVRTHQHNMLFDTGAGDAGSSVAGSVLVPVLNKQQIRALDLLMVSHGDNDHAGGVTSILANVDVLQLLSGQAIGATEPADEPCQTGQRWQWDEVKFAVLHPGDTRNASPNNQSCVLQVATQGQTLLLPGDIESAVERELVLALGNKLRSDVLIAPHHGSNTSSGFPFLKTVQPEAVIFSAGYRNGFGHPAEDVTARYQTLGIAQWSTARQGAVRILLSPVAGSLHITTAREANPRYWRASGYGQ